MRLEFDLPTKETPGFLRRQRAALEFQARTRAGMTPDLVDEMVQFLVPYVSVPESREEAAEALWDASQEQFDTLFNALTGQESDPNP